MKRYHSDDDLDRALFALDLEEPPADLRASILSATLYRAPFVQPRDAWIAGILAAVIVWLLVMLFLGNTAPFAGALRDIGSAVAAFGRLDLLFWIALGVSTAFWISQLNLTVVPGVATAARR